MIGAIIAMQCEADILLKDMQIEKTETLYDKKIYIGKAHGHDIVLVVCGVGKVNAACGAQIAIDLYHADTLLNFGVAGGVSDKTEVAAVYQIQKVVQYDFDLAGLNHTKIGTLDECKENYLPLSVLDVPLPRLNLATADRFNDNREDHLLIKDYMEADIRDMEGGAVAQVAMHARLPVYEWKAISDKAGNVSSFEQYNRNKLSALDRLHGYFPALFALLP
jgi:adenosylhomocysteine nucleosidase